MHSEQNEGRSENWEEGRNRSHTSAYIMNVNS